MSQKVTSPAELRTALAAGEVEFSFQKKNGDLRFAKGTTNLGLIPEEKQPDDLSNHADGVVVFFDTDKKEFRSVSESSLMFK